MVPPEQGCQGWFSAILEGTTRNGLMGILADLFRYTWMSVRLISVPHPFRTSFPLNNASFQEGPWNSICLKPSQWPRGSAIG